MKKLAEFVIRYRWAVIVFFLALTAFMGFQMKNASFNPDLLTYLPEHLPSRMNQKQIEKMFGGTDMVMIVVQTDDVVNGKTLKRVEHFSQDMQNIKGIERVMSVFELKNVRSENDAMTVDAAVKMIPRTAEDVATIKKELAGNDLVYGSVISKDFTTTAIIGLLEPGAKDKDVIDQVEAMIAKYPGTEKVLLGGSPYMRMQNAGMMQKDMARLIPLGLLLMMVFLFISFRQFRGVWLPILIVVMAIFTALGATPLLGWKFAVTTIILVVLLIATANSYGIHMFARYQRDNLPGNNYTAKELSVKMVTSLGAPIILSGLTTIAGLLCMLGHVLIPGGQMGVLGSIGIGLALIGSLFFIPALSSVLPKTKPRLRADNNPKSKRGIGLDRLLDFIADWVTKKPKTILALFVVISLIGAAGLLRFSINSNPAELFPDGHPAKESAQIINKELGGFFPLCVVFEGDIKDPALLKKIDDLEKKVREIPEVGTTQSIAKVTRQISRALYNKGEEGYDKIPNTYDAVSQYFELYLMSGSQKDLEKMVDFNFEKALLMIRFKELNTPVLRQCVAQIKEMVKDDPNVKLVGGNADVFTDMDKHVVSGQFLSLLISLVVVFIIISLGFKSFKAGLLQIVPLMFAMLMLFGLMGYFGIDLNFMTAFQASILIGVGVDYTIHVVWRYREERRAGYDDKEAVHRLFKATGRGIVFNAIAVIIGFVVLLFSGFLPVRFFGMMMVTIIFVCLIAAVLLVPALCMVLKPKFLRQKIYCK